MSINNIAIDPIEKEMIHPKYNKLTETFSEECNNINVVVNNSTNESIYTVFHILMIFIAMYLYFKCRKGGDHAYSTLVFALACPQIYIIYILATEGGVCSVTE